MEALFLILALLGAYLAGSVPFAYLAGRLMRGIDIRQHGSGNVGATNVFRVLGTRAGVAVLLLDMGKGVAAVLACPSIWTAGPQGLDVPYVRIACALAAFAGHAWPVWLQFRGGKGVAVGAGAFLGLVPVGTLIAVAVFVAVLGATRYVSLSSVCAAAAMPVAVALLRSPAPYLVLSAVFAVLVVFTHRSNIRRLVTGRETRVGGRARDSGEGQ